MEAGGIFKVALGATVAVKCRCFSRAFQRLLACVVALLYSRGVAAVEFAAETAVVPAADAVAAAASAAVAVASWPGEMAGLPFVEVQDGPPNAPWELEYCLAVRVRLFLRPCLPGLTAATKKANDALPPHLEVVRTTDDVP